MNQQTTSNQTEQASRCIIKNYLLQWAMKGGFCIAIDSSDISSIVMQCM